jgi:hypothetical protein
MTQRPLTILKTSKSRRYKAHAHIWLTAHPLQGHIIWWPGTRTQEMKEQSISITDKGLAYATCPQFALQMSVDWISYVPLV